MRQHLTHLAVTLVCVAWFVAIITLSGCSAEVDTRPADAFGVACEASGRPYDDCMQLCFDEYFDFGLFWSDTRPVEACQSAVRREMLSEYAP